MTLLSARAAPVMAVLALLLWARPSAAESTRLYELEGFGHFLDGNPESTSVTEDGAIALPPQVRERLVDAAVGFSAAAVDGDDVVAARSDDGQVVRIGADGKVRPLYRPKQTMVTALLVHGDDVLIATAPEGTVYRLTKKGATEVFFRAEAKFIWALSPGPGGSILAATGEPGGIVQLDPKGAAKSLFSAPQAHIRSLAYAPQLGIFAGGGERGVLYFAAPGQPFVALYDTGNQEITAVVPHAGGAYIAGVSGAAALAQDEPKKSSKTGEVRSQVLRVGLDGTAEMLAGSADEAVFALALDNQDNVLVGTGASGRDDPRGRIYSIEPRRRVIKLLYQSPSRRISHLLQQPGERGLLCVAADAGRITQLTAQLAPSGVFLTQPFDAAISSRFGVVEAMGQFPPGTRTELQVRTGQTAQPDATWSPFSKVVLAPQKEAAQVPAGRFMQGRITLHSHAGASPQVTRLRVAFLRQNLAPFVRDVTLLDRGLALYALPRDESRTKVVALADKSADKANAPDEGGRRGAPGRARQVAEPGSITVKWVADDPNGDELRFALWMRAVEEDSWRLIKDDLVDPFYTMQARQFADGYYIFRVEASDAPSNPVGAERRDSRESRAQLIDNTPPSFAPIVVRTRAGLVTASTQVHDAVGPLVRLSYALDGAESRPVAPVDGMLDGPQEQVALHLGRLARGRHTLTLRAQDEAGNEGFAASNFSVK